MGPAVLEVVKSFGQVPVDEPFGRERNLAALDPGLKKVPNIHTHLFANALGDHDLKFRLYGNNVHSMTLGIQFNCQTVQLDRSPVNTCQIKDAAPQSCNRPGTPWSPIAQR